MPRLGRAEAEAQRLTELFADLALPFLWFGFDEEIAPVSAGMAVPDGSLLAPLAARQLL
jgi:hypothetical protein